MPRGWFVYVGPIGGNYCDPAFYLYNGNPLPTCSGSGRACIVYAYYPPGVPIVGSTHPYPYPFSENMCHYLNPSGSYTLPLPLGSVKKYMYVKS